MKKIQVFILFTVAMLLFSGCNQKDVIQNTSDSPIQTSVPMENQNKELSSLKQKVYELETELQQRVGHLENYFDRRTPESVARLYGDAVKTRNGALQYALFSKKLKDENYDYFASVGWHTGVSNSPSISNFTVGKPIQSEDGQTVINIIFHYTVKDGNPANETCTLSLEQTQKETNDDWYITSLKNGH